MSKIKIKNIRKYFLSWVGIVFSTIIIIFLFFILLFLNSIYDFENPGGIYFYLYFIYPPLWLSFSAGITFFLGLRATRKQNLLKKLGLLLVNFLTGILGIGLVILLLYLLNNQSEKNRQSNLETIRSNTLIRGAEWEKVDENKNDMFDHLLIKYQLEYVGEEIHTNTFVTAKADTGGEYGSWILTSDDDYIRDQKLSEGVWDCQLLLNKYSWDIESNNRANSFLNEPNYVTNIQIRLEDYSERVPKDIINENYPLDINFSDFEIGFEPVDWLEQDRRRELRQAGLPYGEPICTKQQIF
ncbi:MAG: hypothetical protein ABFQ62_00785 [Patescibacteria group bacterium]